LNRAGDDVDGIYRLMHSNSSPSSGQCLEDPANIGDPEYVTVKELVDMVTQVSGKRINVEWVKGPVGAQSRNFSDNKRIYSLGWRARVATLEGIQHTYPWIEEQVRRARAGK
jgi:GDP-D-mannose 3',5'-epimerase